MGEIPKHRILRCFLNNVTYASDNNGVLFNKDKTSLICCSDAYSGAYTIPSSVTSIGGSAFNGCPGLTCIYFCGNAPSFGNDPFYEVSATAYYPAGNSTWTDELKQNYGDNLTWVPWTPTNGAATSAPEVRGLHTGKADGSTVSFSDLTPGTQYVLIVSRDKNSDLLASGNLLYIAQAAANADGTLAFTSVPQAAVANAFVGLFGQGKTVPDGYTPCDGVTNCRQGLCRYAGEGELGA